MKSKSVRLVGGFAVAAALSLASHAAPVTYFGVNSTPGGAVSGAPVSARTAFLSNLTSTVRTETFESFAIGTEPLVTLSFTGSTDPIAALISGAGFVSNSTVDGTFNTSPGGTRWWDVSGDFSIDFTGKAISAFGFYATDVGDFNGQVKVNLLDINDMVTTFTLPTALNAPNGGLLFFGFVDRGNSYKRITFGNTGAGVDSFGFDDMVIGDAGQLQTPVPTPVPEPTSLALVGLALTAAGFAARRQRRA